MPWVITRVVVIADVDLAADRSLEQPGGQVLVVYLFTEKQRTLDGTHVSRRFELDRGEFGEFRFVHQAGAEPVLGFTERSVGGATGPHAFATCSADQHRRGGRAGECSEDRDQGRSDDPAAGILGGAARRAWQRRNDAASERGADRGAFVGVEIGQVDAQRPGGEGRERATLRRPWRPGAAVDAGWLRQSDEDGRFLDRHGPLQPDRIPAEEAVLHDGVAMECVLNPVAVPSRDRDLRMADADFVIEEGFGDTNRGRRGGG